MASRILEDEGTQPPAPCRCRIRSSSACCTDAQGVRPRGGAGDRSRSRIWGPAASGARPRRSPLGRGLAGPRSGAGPRARRRPGRGHRLRGDAGALRLAVPATGSAPARSTTRTSRSARWCAGPGRGSSGASGPSRGTACGPASCTSTSQPARGRGARDHLAAGAAAGSRRRARPARGEIAGRGAGARPEAVSRCACVPTRALPHYDPEVQGRTVLRPGDGDAGVCSCGGTSRSESRSDRRTARWGDRDARRAGTAAVARRCGTSSRSAPRPGRSPTASTTATPRTRRRCRIWPTASTRWRRPRAASGCAASRSAAAVRLRQRQPLQREPRRPRDPADADRGLPRRGL